MREKSNNSDEQREGVKVRGQIERGSMTLITIALVACLRGFQKVKRVLHTSYTRAPPPHRNPSLLCSFIRECTGKILFAGWRVWASLFRPCVKTKRDYTFCESISHMPTSIGAIYK